MDAAEREALPDSQYAFPKERKEPLNDASHVRNAIARFDQVRDVTDRERAEAFERIKRAAKKFGVSFGWASAFYVPQQLGTLGLGPLDDSVWHVGQAFLKLHFRFPYQVRR